MAFTVIDALRANLVFRGIRFLPEDSDFDDFREAMQTEVIRRTEVVDDQQRIDVMLMSRERTSLLLGGDGSQIERQHPDRDDLALLADATSTCIDKSTLGEDEVPEAYGYNMELVFDQDSEIPAGEYLASQMLGEALASSGVPWKSTSGGFDLRLEEEGRTWTFQVEPRFWEKDTTRVFVKVNHHRDEQTLPSRHEILADLELTWDRSHMLLNSIAQGGR
ncbi:MAG: hypothetical protein OXH41_10400 [Chloroflexi bacterium]|nr:hypothetical protein [Chloroflexota bacterium]